MNDRTKDCYIVSLYGKRPHLQNWTQIRVKQRDEDHMDNYGILMGKVNDIMVLDIDVKDNGVAYWDKLTETHAVPNTFTVKTGSGGFHFYFKYDASFSNGIKVFKDEDGKHVGIDFLTDGKMAVAHGSIHPDTGKEYKIINDAPIGKMPKWFAKLYKERSHADEFKREKKAEKEDNAEKEDKITPPHEFDLIKGRIYGITDEGLIKLLNELPTCFFEGFNKWITLTNILKGLGKKEIWDEYSKKSPAKYDKEKNETIWNNIIPFININYLVNYLNKFCAKKLPFVKYTINYKPITDIHGIKEEKITARYLKEHLQDKDNDLNELYNTLIIKSDTGTGKTTYTSHKFKNEEFIISISSRRSLVEQQIETFSKEKIEMEDYRKNIRADKICIQFDSIWKLTEAEDAIEKIKKSVVYMDEINSSLKYLLRTETMRKKRISVFQSLIKIIKNAKYVMATDADISDVCFKFMHYFRDVNKTLYINNDYKNYNNIQATQHANLADILTLMDKDITEGRYFVATFDTVRQLELVAAKLNKGKNRDDFLKIHSKGNDNVTTDNWKNKYVFYSPKIIYGTDFNPPEKTSVYVFCSGKTIDTLEIAQQMTRCRKILNVNYYFNAPVRSLYWDNIQAYEEHIRNNLDKYCDILKEFGCIILSFDCQDYILQENIFYELFVYCDFINKIITSNYLYHFNNILLNKGFENNVAEPTETKIDAKEIAELQQMSDDEYETICENYALGIMPNNMDDFLETIKNRMDILNINRYNYTDPETVDEEDRADIITGNKKRYDLIKRYKKYIFDDRCLKVHFNIVNMCKIDKEIKQEIEKTTDYQVKSKDNIHIKILLLNELDTLIGLPRFDMTLPKTLDKKATKNIISIKDIIDVFKINTKPQNTYTLAEIYEIRARAYKKTFGATDNGKGKNKGKKKEEPEKEDTEWIMKAGARIVISREAGKSDRLQTYLINENKIKEHLQLYQQRDRRLIKIDENIIKKYELTPEKDDNNYNNEYMFVDD